MSLSKNPEELWNQCTIPITAAPQTFPWNVEFDPGTAKPRQLQQPLHQDCKPGESTRDNAKQRENKSSREKQQREPINHSDGQTAHFQFLFSNPARALPCWREPTRLLLQNSHLNQAFHGLMAQRNPSREVNVTLHLPHINPCSQLSPNPQGQKGEWGRQSPVVLGWVYSPAGRINGILPALTRWNPSVQKVQGDPLQDKHTSKQSNTIFFNADLQNTSQVLKIQDIS